MSKIWKLLWILDVDPTVVSGVIFANDVHYYGSVLVGRRSRERNLFAPNGIESLICIDETLIFV